MIGEKLIDGDNVEIHKTAKIHKDAVIKGEIIKIGKNVEIEMGFNSICAKKLVIQDNTRIKGNTRFFCRELEIGEHNFIFSINIEGSMNSINSRVKIGDQNLIMQNTRINCNEKVTIGSDVGIGQYVDIWAHGSFMNVLNGYPYICKPVTIGNHVWLTARSTVLPGVNIGNNIVILNNSVVNRNIPDGSLCGGIPIKIIKKNYFPIKLSQSDIDKIVNKAIQEYKQLLKLKDFDVAIKYEKNQISFKIKGEGEEIIFDLNKRKISGIENKYSEDFRDFLRSRGIKIFTDKPFDSIITNDFRKWL